LWYLIAFFGYNAINMINTLLLQENKTFHTNEKVNIILSCEMYWCKIFSIPIDSMSEVKTVLPSFFEEYFDTTNYKFLAIKKAKHTYLSFAYNEQDIIEKIKKSNLEFKQVQNIYFAQNELVEKFEESKIYTINDSLYAIQNELLVQVPELLSQDLQKEQFDLNSISLSKHKIYLNQSSKYIDIKTAYILSSIFLVFSLLNFSKIYDINNNIKAYEYNIQNLKKEYSLPLSTIQTKSIIQEYKNNKKQYLKLLKQMQYILDYKQSIDVKLIDIEYKNKKLFFTFENKNIALLKKYFEKNTKILSLNNTANFVKIGVQI
jgi:hypothetical protein